MSFSSKNNVTISELASFMEDDIRKGKIPTDSIKKGIEDANRTSSKTFQQQIGRIDDELTLKRLNKFEK